MRIRNLLPILVLAAATTVYAQEKPEQWDLNGCINYALVNNIQIQQSKISLEQNQVNTKLAKAALFPSLTGGINQNYSNNPFTPSNVYTGSYSISSSMTLFDAGKTLKNIEQQKLNEQAGQYAVLEAEKNIQMSILQTYLQILYADEAVKINKSTVEVSEFQMKRGQELQKAGSISKVDVAQLESQYSSDKYQLTVSENSLSTYKLQLKQLLELPLNETINMAIPEINSTDVLHPLPSLASVYEQALNVMPQVKSSELSVKIANLETAKAKTGYYPKLSLNAGISTGHGSGTNFSLSEQFKNNWNNGIGITVSVPVFSNRENKSAVEKAQLSEKNSQLQLVSAQKELLQEIESVYQSAVSAQSQYYAALEKQKSLKSSYELIQQQFELGMKNTLDLLTEKNNYLAAQQNVIQAKYLSIMNAQLLNLYQNKTLEIK
ncbi:MAG: outer rane efflux protein [Bacteroidetes bacterium]|nr:outer rane efflux protein [Bacteroidota bacterium]